MMIKIIIMTITLIIRIIMVYPCDNSYSNDKNKNNRWTSLSLLWYWQQHNLNPQIGYFKLTCTSFYACPATGEPARVFECGAGELYDEGAAKCVPAEDLRPRPFVCGCDDGAFPDTNDCSHFHICASGSAVGEPLSCPEGHVFNSERGFCVEGECSANECLEAARIWRPSEEPQWCVSKVSSFWLCCHGGRRKRGKGKRQRGQKIHWVLSNIKEWEIGKNWDISSLPKWSKIGILTE